MGTALIRILNPTTKRRLHLLNLICYIKACWTHNSHWWKMSYVFNINFSLLKNKRKTTKHFCVCCFQSNITCTSVSTAYGLMLLFNFLSLWEPFERAWYIWVYGVLEATLKGGLGNEVTFLLSHCTLPWLSSGRLGLGQRWITKCRYLDSFWEAKVF